MDGFVDRLHALRFLRACDPSYGALTFTLVGLPPTGYISLLLDILFGSFLPSLWSSSNQSLLGSKEPTLLCNHVESSCQVSAHCQALVHLALDRRGFRHWFRMSAANFHEPSFWRRITRSPLAFRLFGGSS